jgi:hypothetical protein
MGEWKKVKKCLFYYDFKFLADFDLHAGAAGSVDV